MTLPAHLGFGHPSLVWVAVIAVLAFVAGLGVNLYRSRKNVPFHESRSGDDGSK